MFWISAVEMRWFYRSILYCKLLLTCNGFLSSSRFSLLTGIHWTDTQVIQSHNKSCFMILTIIEDFMLRAGSSASVEGLFSLHCHPTSSHMPSLWLVDPCGCSALRLSGKALRGGALHQGIAGIYLPMPLSSLCSCIKTLYIPWRMCMFPQGSPLCWSQLLWAAGNG